MSRIKIDIPTQKPLFTTTFSVRVTDLNYGNHLGNDRMLVLAQEVRVAWLSKLELSELNIGGPGLIQSDAAVIYKKEVHYGEKLVIELFAADLTAVSFDLIYKVTSQDQVVALIKTGMVIFNYDTKRVSPLPEEFKTTLIGT